MDDMKNYNPKRVVIIAAIILASMPGWAEDERIRMLDNFTCTTFRRAKLVKHLQTDGIN